MAICLDRQRVDVLVIGGGMIGAACAWALCGRFKVALVEAETTFGYHATGRSAALYSEYFGDPITAGLTRASRHFFNAPPPGFSPQPLLRRRGTVALASADDHRLGTVAAALSSARLANLPIDQISLSDARRLCPILRPRGYTDAVYRPSTWDIDVAGLHQGFLREARRKGAVLFSGVRLLALHPYLGGWLARGEISSRPGEWQADAIVNAGGAWADAVAQLADVPPLGLVARRRTMLHVTLPAPPGQDWPMINDLADSFYFKPESGGLIVSPCDAAPSPPCDAQPEELDVAMAMERLENVTSLKFHHVGRKWAGLRTFTPDGGPVLGAAPQTRSFIWAAGLGGAGIQTAPALGKAAAAILADEELPAELRDTGLTRELLSPCRLTPMRAPFWAVETKQGERK